MLKYWLLVLALCPAFADHGGLLTVHFVDVGQGDAIALRTPRGRWIVVEIGRAHV